MFTVRLNAVIDFFHLEKNTRKFNCKPMFMWFELFNLCKDL